MTRINLVDPAALSDQHLRAELRELPRVFSSKIDISDAPERYCLGKGHVKWAKAHPFFIMNRYKDLYKEALFRGFKVKYTPEDLEKKFWDSYLQNPQAIWSAYKVSTVDYIWSMVRIRERYLSNPDAHRWTKREKPLWVSMDDDEFEAFIGLLPKGKKNVKAKKVYL